MLKFNHFIFDFDGTLSDSYPVFVRSMREALLDCGVEKAEEEIYLMIKRYSIGSAVLAFAPKGKEEECSLAFRERNRKSIKTDAQPIDGAEELLKYVTENGGKCYIYSHSGSVVIDNLQRWGLDGYFTDYQLAGGGFPRKPAPDALLDLMSRNQLMAEECVMIGDRDIDVLAGKNAGVAGILMDVENYYTDLPVEYRVKTLMEIKECIQA